jgi:putative salt-induced outer membrane protein
MNAWKLAACAAILTPCAALAEDPASPPTPWSGDASLGYIRTTGNTNSTAFNAKGDLDWKSSPWENQFKALAAYGSSKGESTSETYLLGDKLSRDLSPQDYVFASLDYLNDRFAGVASRWSEALGYGRHLIKTDRQTLDADIGAGASQSRDAEATGYNNQFIGVFNLAYLLKISPSAQFRQALHVEAGADNTFINPVAELKLNIVGSVFATLAYDWRHNSSVPEGNVHTDTITTVNFGYTFGKKPG